MTVHLICAGQLSPDSDFIRQWVGLFNDSMVKKDGGLSSHISAVSKEV
jgi:hypothetical protein